MSSSKRRSLYLPDINVWFALTREDHAHRGAALQWWQELGDDRVGIVRVTQFGLLRLLTNAVAMNRQPLTMVEAWRVYEKLFEDDRVAFLPEPEGIDAAFRKHTSIQMASHGLWADRWLVAFAEVSGAILLTCDKALAKESKSVKLLVSSK
jgi:toxin-antitoxin system PIN domain toxin